MMEQKKLFIRSVIAFLLIVLTGVGLALVGPWWLPLVACFVFCAWAWNTGWMGFLVGGLGIMTLWLGSAWYLNQIDSTGLLDHVGVFFMSQMPHVTIMQQMSGQSFLLILMGIFAFLLGGLAGLSGSWVRRYFNGPARD